MKNTQKGFIGILVIILIAVAAIGGVAYVYTHKNTPQTLTVPNTPTENSDKNNEEVTPKNTPSPVVTASTTVTTKVVVTTPAPITVSTGQNCGTVLDAHVLFQSDKRTSAETQALGCISKAILSCSSASLNVTGDDTGKYEVFNKNGENCVIGSTFGGNRKCEVPVKVISDLEKYAVREKQPIEDLIAPISLLLGFGETKNVETGETIKISCQTY